MSVEVGSQQTTSLRRLDLDIIRVIGVIAVVAGHAWDSEWIHRLLYPWHVPVFFILAGYLWRDNRALSDEVARRFRTLAVPYSFWIAVLLCLLVVFRKLNGTLDVREVMKTLYGGVAATAPFSAFWFVSALFVGSVFFRLLSELKAGFFTAIVLALLVTSSLAGEQVARLPLSIGSGALCVLFLVVGRFIRRASMLTKPHPLFVSFLAVFLFAVFASGLLPSLDLKRGDYGFPVLGIVAAAMAFVVLLGVSGALSSLIGREGGFQSWITRLASCSLGVVLIHAFPIMVLRGLAPTWCIFLSSLIVSWLISVAFLRFKVGRAVLGVG
ncbi:acyltransferase family protein [Rhodococcus opacus]|uniref:Putative acyltransferase n=1 Tax=Rhodococcus opacus (strain B4) TaxID=632772 RepID=C1AWI6_RHOOB|nr:acyltransferase family protein [Rhodococcus opacus]BAH53759.1 putative acyltransferase [Rhodococcus opacus B4]